MMTSQSDVRPKAPDTTHPVKRRGLLAAGVALVAGLVAKLTEQPVSAGTDGDVVLGQSNTETFTTTINNTTANGLTFVADCFAGTDGWGVEGGGSGYGVVGFHDAPMARADGAGVLGQTFVSGGSGVHGYNNAGGTPAVGVRGDSLTSPTGIGVLGQGQGNGVFGQITPGATNGIAVYGQNYSTYSGPSPGAGGFGVYGLSAKGHGLVGATATAGGAAVVGATNGVLGAYAGAFYGPVSVSGALTVFGAKSAAVPHPDGSHRRLYCMESPESWFEDFGTGHLECGRAEIPIDPDFAAMVRLDDYHVFLMDRGSKQLLSVVRQTPSGFAVEANPMFAALTGKQDTDLNGPFSWRVVARRKDIAGDRLETVTIPAEPVLPPVLDIPTPTPPTARPTR